MSDNGRDLAFIFGPEMAVKYYFIAGYVAYKNDNYDEALSDLRIADDLRAFYSIPDWANERTSIIGIPGDLWNRLDALKSEILDKQSRNKHI